MLSYLSMNNNSKHERSGEHISCDDISNIHYCGKTIHPLSVKPFTAVHFVNNMT